jgi:5-methylcytosine-specific restriction endonuclease McrA
MMPSRTGGTLTQGYCGCGNLQALKGLDVKGRKTYRSNCKICRTKAQKNKKTYCQKCLIVPRDKKELDVDHIDMDRSNNHINNLQTLCKKCHLDKTLKERLVRK